MLILYVLGSDYVIVPAALATIAWLATLIAQVTIGGLGKHYWDQTYQETYWSQRLEEVGILIFFFGVSLIKISIVLFNRRLTGLTSQRWMMAHYAFLTLIVGFLISALFTIIFRCTSPVKEDFSLIALGEASSGQRKCLDINKLGYGLAIAHSALDFMLLTVPLIILWRLKTMSRSKKIRLAFLFRIGAVSCIGSVMRQVIQDRIIKTKDVNWELPHLYAWTIVDIFFGIAAANLPVFNALIPKRWRSGRTSANNAPHLSPWKNDSGNSASLDDTAIPQRLDGTVVEKSDVLRPDVFHERTVQRWDEAFVKAEKRKSMGKADLEGDVGPQAASAV